MRMNFNQYIQNPMGVANSVISNREMYRVLYTNKLNQIMVREAGRMANIKNHLYKDGKRYIAYIKIPSEKISDFYYDILIEFTEPDPNDPNVKKKVTGYGLEDYYVRFYANDPSFFYTFVHAFIKNDMFFKDMKHKMPKRNMKEVAKEKNPQDVVGYVKSLYFAYLLMIRQGLFNKLKYTETFNQEVIDRLVLSAEIMVEKRQEAAESNAKVKREKKARAKQGRQDHLEKELPGNIKMTKVVSNVKNTISNKASKFVKTTKRK
ncbi:MAG: hypothetical protein PHC62_00275 [Candidatus Izemoplasmatales bacterium]|nr:hypothetical protein [Candidatus Izemoplasmatales bacterium]